jgi:hypothetical protein
MVTNNKSAPNSNKTKIYKSERNTIVSDEQPPEDELSKTQKKSVKIVLPPIKALLSLGLRNSILKNEN